MAPPDDVDADAALTVLMSFGPPHRETNPYLVQLVESLPDAVTVRYFSWSDALLGRFDVFHLHWPEIKLRGSSPARTVLCGVAFLLVLLRLRLRHKALVRTLHNERPHERLSFVQTQLLALCDRWTTAWIVLSDAARPPSPGATARIPLGHDRDWAGARSSGHGMIPGRLVHFGLVRPYKGVTDLLHAFADLDDPGATLRVVGKTVDDGLAREIGTLAGRDPRVTVVDDYVTDERLVAEICQSELVVLPFRQLTNSSSVLLALSLDRPVLAPAVPAIEELAHEVGSDWLLTYAGRLTSDHLASALCSVRRASRTGRPDLTRRDWEPIGSAHASIYRRAKTTASCRGDS